MSEKTLGDYMKMLNSVEDESSSDEEVTEEKDTGCSCGCKDGECTCPSDCECGCNRAPEIPEDESEDESMEESVDVRAQDLNNTWQESSQFMQYVQTNIEKLHEIMKQGLTEVIGDGKEYTCNEYLIVGVTLEQGLMVVIRCEDEYEDQYNAHVEIKESDVEFVEFI